ncbi:MtnX-like HAD-IB family phosphatase [Pelotomaculum propionicicum]|uniref:2-hydroxy-3-keto-5-methylthiopentenyl-1-phosphate phosphatase n=1 Tax=Pelotomaculum propionicicum TaxID=258475 RepID=A0A4Y7RM05_9FIRM|nr:MtnX-like HAD-IB family phosphatase [Pelotomaculum propionicicum]NLI12653.1 MtnX-like HAD-IB family phosphatase [Peptococcaceae bacterium]TEB09770.1 2-hydroxy-3-keto-5-methylthiopentenyl-1-phosphate phosphatase [Pelotomaculum propionicicum]
MSIVIFIDFDGTITKKDTCAAMVEAFADSGWEEINAKWERKEISTEECANMTFKLFRAGLSEVKKLIETMEIDDYFKDFLSYCRDKGYQVYVLSDGYDFCLETVFKKYKIEVPYFANRMIYKQGFEIKCLNANPDCGICGTCKTKLMERLKGEGDLVIYVGDGYSDTCPAMKADIIFARSTLYKYCRENGVSARYFASFDDIISFLQTR